MWRDEAYLMDMLLAAREALQFAEGLTRDTFRQDRKSQMAVMRAVQIIGEAARCISEKFRQAHPQIPWADIVGMRHRLVHEYFRIIPDRVWDLIEKDLPALVAMIEPLVPPDDTSP